MPRAEWHQVISRWQLPASGELLDRIEQMVRPALLAGYFGSNPARLVSGFQSRRGRTETAELAKLANITSADYVLDVCCAIGGPAIQLGDTLKCRVTGVDLAPNCVAAANRIAGLAGLAHLINFRVADAGNLPFEDETFTLIWNQGSLEPCDAWLREFYRVLVPGGRLAMTLEIGKNATKKDSPRWRLDEIVEFIQASGYCIEQQEDITSCDTDFGWKVLERQLAEREREFTWLLGTHWVQQAHAEFSTAIAQMESGEWGTARIIARKKKSS